MRPDAVKKEFKINRTGTPYISLEDGDTVSAISGPAKPESFVFKNEKSKIVKLSTSIVGSKKSKGYNNYGAIEINLR